MVPVVLKWQRPLGGVKTIEAASATFLNGTTTKLFVGSGERPISLGPNTPGFEDVELRVGDLEDPVVVRFVNAWREDGLAGFLSKFGMLRHAPLYDLDVALHAEILEVQLYSSTNHQSRRLNALRVHELIRNARLGAGYEWDSDAKVGRLVLHPETLLDFMKFEVAAAHEAGAVTTQCEHCGKVYLTGPLTGRRSHSKYCADRCRVAAMRKRNAKREAVNVDS